MSKEILYNDEARSAIQKGLDAVANAVKVTIGPKGRNVILEKTYGSPTITNDGVSIAKEISLSNKFENMGAEIAKEVATKTNDLAGDGTTTSMILLQEIVSEGMRSSQAGLEVMGIKRGMSSAGEEIVTELKRQAKNISTNEEIKQVATVSAESEDLGKIIADTIEKIGKDGVVTVEESQALTLTSDLVEGMSFDNGYVSPYMVSDAERMEAVQENVPVLLTDKKISSIESILPLLEKLASTGRKDLVIIADDVDGQALATLVVNKLRGALNVLAIKAPGFGDSKKEMLEDIAVTVGGTVITEDKGMKIEDMELTMLGKIGKVISSKDKTIIISGAGSKTAVQNRVAQLKKQLENTTSSYDVDKLSERIAKLSGGVAVIKVGAATETEMKYLKMKIEDAVNATKAAIEEGVVAGGGTSLLKASQAVLAKKKKFTTQEEEIGYNIVVKACEAPLRNIALNSGQGDGSIVVEKVKELGLSGGYNSLTDGYVEDMISAGIIDPVKVSRAALSNAVSAAGTLLTTQVAIADEKEDKPTAPMMPQGMMPGM